MTRKKRETPKEVTASVLKFREKRKWQIALRRYVLEKNICFDYAPYFGLDIENMRRWFEYQFKNGAGWDDFATRWQFDHIVPVTYFDFSDEEELKLCWNFTNLGVEVLGDKERGSRFDLMAAKNYFTELYNATGYPICESLLNKIEKIQLSDVISTSAQQAFIKENMSYLEMIKDYTAFEFEMINRGRDINEVKKEAELLKKFDTNG